MSEDNDIPILLIGTSFALFTRNEHKICIIWIAQVKYAVKLPLQKTFVSF